VTAIGGLIRFDERPIDRAAIERMQGLLTPYGRDAQQHCVVGSAALVRTLLRIVPEDSLDRQPLLAPTRDHIVVFDGYLDNRTELAEALGLAPSVAAALADSELALHACLRWDESALEKLRGNFAIACWSLARKRLWLARDPIGRRPLFWHRQNGFVVFASLPKALFAVSDVPRALCEERMLDIMALLPWQGPETLFKDIYRVEPGHVVAFDDDGTRARRFHDFDARREIHFANDDDYVEAFREKLDQAVARSLRTTGPVASHLSSGFDSSTVTATAARLLAQRGRRITAYTAVPREGFDGRAMRHRHVDESPGARALAARFDNIDHILIRTAGVSPLAGMLARTEAMDRAMVNPCNEVWARAIEQDAERRGCKVLLTGGLGNMTISYTGLPLLPALFGTGRWPSWWRELAAVKGTHPQRRWLGLLKDSIGPYLPTPLWSLLMPGPLASGDLSGYTALHPAMRARLDIGGRARAQGWDLHYRPWRDGRRMRIDLLGRVDRGEYSIAANLAGLDLRDPTIDLDLFEYCLAVPDRQYLRNGQTRWLLHRAMGDVLPPEIRHARTKGLQAADWYEGVRDDLPLIRETLARLRSHATAADWLDLDALQAAVENWPDDGFDEMRTVQEYQLKLLRGLAAGTFIRYVEPDNR
jgi:asparagine synthase (glutamine-hydrolysing)